MAQFSCPSRFRKYSHFFGEICWHDIILATILQVFAWMLLLSPLSPWPKSENWPKLTQRPKICRILDFDENDTIESEKFKELNGDIFSIWFFVSNETTIQFLEFF